MVGTPEYEHANFLTEMGTTLIFKITLFWWSDLEDHIFCVILILKIKITSIFKCRVG